MTLGILVLAFFKRAWLLEAIGLAQAAPPTWLLLGLVTIMLSSQVFQVVLLLTRSTATLTRWLLRLRRLLARALRWPRDAAWIKRTVDELTRVRGLVADSAV